jgi:PKD repeat protein
VTNALGSNTSTQVINVQACSAPNVNFSVASLTACTNVPFTATNTSSGGAPAPSYSWVASSGGTITPSSVVSTPSFAFANPGTYSITLIGTNSQGTVGSTQVVTVTSCAPLANFSIPASMYRCYKTSTFVTLTTTNNTQANSSAGANSYTWSINPTSGVQNLTGLTLVNYSAKLTHSLITTYTVTLRAKNASGTSTLSQVLTIDTLCLSVNLYENSSLENNVSVFPNPAHDQVTVKIASAGTEAHNIRIINVLGAVVYDEKIARGSKESVSISLAGKPKGVYFVTVENGSERTTRKIIIE